VTNCLTGSYASMGLALKRRWRGLFWGLTAFSSAEGERRDDAFGVKC
jgi:hypothetical protein